MRHNKLFGSASVLLLAACASGPELGCIIPPPTISESESETAIEIATILESLMGSGNLVSEFRDVVRVHFARLSEPNACLFLFLKAIECYMQEGDIGAEMAREMAAIVRVAWAQRCGFENAPLQLTDQERAFIEESRYREILMEPMRKIGMQ